jgi:hypothetical protein
LHVNMRWTALTQLILCIELTGSTKYGNLSFAIEMYT